MSLDHIIALGVEHPWQFQLSDVKFSLSHISILWLRSTFTDLLLIDTSMAVDSHIGDTFGDDSLDVIGVEMFVIDSLLTC